MSSITFWEAMYQVMESGLWARLPGWPVVIRLNDQLGEMYLYDFMARRWLIPYMPTKTDLYETSWEYVSAKEAEKESRAQSQD